MFKSNLPTPITIDINLEPAFARHSNNSVDELHLTHASPHPHHPPLHPSDDFFRDRRRSW
jgi:hypothetical protein